jgi:ubiquitin C-terminal hydrolase
MAQSINAGNKGLINLGNTCYMNSVLQCLSHLLIFHPKNEEFFNECSNLEDGLMHEWFQFQRKMWSNDNSETVTPINLLRCFRQICSEKDLYFENFNQNDVDEFLTIFLDLLHESIKRKVTINLRNKNGKESESSKIVIKGFETWKRFYENDYSYIVENFYSQLLCLTICPECYYFTSNHDPIQVISLEIPENAETIYDCFDNYTKKRILDKDNMWKCDKCNQKVQPHQKTLLFKTSEILIILLKRYTSSLRKNNKFIRYPMNLHLKDYNKNYGTKDANIYSLNGFCIHSGSLGGGHYYAVSKNFLDKNWYEYNDSSVNKISIEKTLKYTPYLFFYKRI